MSHRASSRFSKVNLLLRKAEPISDAGTASVIAIIRKGKKNCGAAMWEEWGGEERNNSIDTKMKKEGEEELAVKKICSSLWRRPEESCPPSAHGEPWCSRCPLCSQGRAHDPAMLELWRRLQPTDSPWKWAHTASDLLAFWGDPNPYSSSPFLPERGEVREWSWAWKKREGWEKLCQAL